MSAFIINMTSAGSGNVTGPSSAVDGEVALFGDTTGQLIKWAIAVWVANPPAA